MMPRSPYVVILCGQMEPTTFHWIDPLSNEKLYFIHIVSAAILNTYTCYYHCSSFACLERILYMYVVLSSLFTVGGMKTVTFPLRTIPSKRNTFRAVHCSIPASHTQAIN